MQGIRYKQLALPKKESPSQVHMIGLSRELKELVWTTYKCYMCNLESAWIIDPSAYRPKSTSKQDNTMYCNASVGNVLVLQGIMEACAVRVN